MVNNMGFNEKAACWDTPERIGRAKVQADFIKTELGRSSGLTALEIGCGTGLVAFGLRDYFSKIYCIDSSEGMLAVLREKIKQNGAENLVACDTALLSRKEYLASFDVVYSVMAFHHIVDIKAELLLLRQTLKSGGHLIIIDLDTDDGSFHSGEPDFNGHHGFDRQALGLLLAQCGFSAATFKTLYSGVKPVGEKPVAYSLFLCHACSC